MRVPSTTAAESFKPHPDGPGEHPFPEEFHEAACRFFREFNGNPPSRALSDFLVRFERAIIFETLTNMNGCQRKAARFLGLKNTTLNQKIKALNIQVAKIPVLPRRAEVPPPVNRQRAG